MVKDKAPTSHCVFCGRFIEQTDGTHWYDSIHKVLPQYCWIDPMLGSRLHEPDPNYTKTN
jgi:hypothetical protein